jgi:hypothetical protein
MIDNNIILSSNHYNGQLTNLLFKHDNDDITINFGVVTLPFLLKPYLLMPPRVVYETYTFLTFDPTCNNVLQVPIPTTSPTPTKTVTPIPIPSFNPCLV